ARRGHCRTQHRQPGGRRRRGAGAPVHAGARPGFGAVMSIERVLSLIASTITVVLDHPWVLLPIAAVALVAIILSSPAGEAARPATRGARSRRRSGERRSSGRGCAASTSRCCGIAAPTPPPRATTSTPGLRAGAPP